MRLVSVMRERGRREARGVKASGPLHRRFLPGLQGIITYASKLGGGLCHCEPPCFFLLAKIVGHSSPCARLHWKGGDQSSESCDQFWSRTPADRPVFGRRTDGGGRSTGSTGSTGSTAGVCAKKKGVQAAENLRPFRIRLHVVAALVDGGRHASRIDDTATPRGEWVGPDECVGYTV